MTENQHLDPRAMPEPDQLRLPVGRVEEEVGIQLKQQRQKRKLSLEQAARALKLPATSLDKLERGEFDDLAPIYRRGYVQNYARYLGLEPGPLVGLLGEQEPSALTAVMPLPRERIKFDRILKFSTYLIVTTLIVPPLILIYIQGGLRFFDDDPQSASGQIAESVAQASDIRVAERMARALALDTPDQAEGEMDSLQDTTRPPLTATALPVGAIRPLRDPALNPDSADRVASPTEVVESITGSTLILEVLEDSWLEVYAANGERLEYDLLRQGDRREFVAEPPFRLLLGRANAVSLKLDGAPVEFEGQDRADVASFELLADGEIRR
ncbi:MAG: RodZ domain-containing protein [Wenzhouxiangella sp.]|jgi:cytoskeleton protein RodZ|nr:RodZ domain-containing protein [Wenzhouxiangella sp.]